jgi:transcriptional regulator with XRE-family HTH domain
MPRIKELKTNYMLTDIGSTLDTFRRQKKIKQKDLAEMCGLTQQNLSNKFTHNSFKYGDLIKIFHALELTDDQIVRLMKL